MSIRWYSTVIDCHDLAAQARWWAEALGWVMAYESEDEVGIVPEYALHEEIPVDRQGPALVFRRVPEDKTVKNRLHIDVAPRAGDDQAAEVARLERLGARRIDIGQGDDSSWVVLADPEGNEFCVLTPRDE
jgi:hypothetical protein